MTEINIEQAEAMFHRGLDACGEVLEAMHQPHREATPAEVSGLLTGILGYILQKAGGEPGAQEVLDHCWRIALDGHKTMVETEGAEDV